MVDVIVCVNSFFERTQDREPNLKAPGQFIAEQPFDGELIILVTHFVTITAITNESVSSGEGVLLKLNEETLYEIVGRLGKIGFDLHK